MVNTASAWPPSTARWARRPTAQQGRRGRHDAAAGARPGAARHARVHHRPGHLCHAAAQAPCPSRCSSRWRPASPSPSAWASPVSLRRWRWRSCATATSTAKSSGWTARCAWPRDEPCAHCPPGRGLLRRLRPGRHRVLPQLQQVDGHRQPGLLHGLRRAALARTGEDPRHHRHAAAGDPHQVHPGRHLRRDAGGAHQVESWAAKTFRQRHVIKRGDT
jgi:hypothetical protein